MDDIVIKVNNLSKVYHLYDKPEDRVKEALNPFRKKYHHDFYALDDVSFEIKKGETVGILGKNGAGKSTLLKIITGVLTPTNGNVEVNGKIASLLELGAGFNPDLTGLENIYLNGTIMGLTRKDIDNRIDAILDFADIGEFIHQFVKTYSSGMFARLAFSVAINVNPDILIIDEALSVGDIEFQTKCMQKMEDITTLGTTILLVSHDIQSIKKFSDSVIWFDKGKIIQSGHPNKILEDYMSFISYGLETQRDSSTNETLELKKNSSLIEFIDMTNLDSFGKKQALILKIVFINDNGSATTYLKQGTWINFICEFETSIDLYNVAIGVLFKDNKNNEIVTFNSYMYGCPINEVKKNAKIKTSVKFKVPKIYPKEYVVTVALSEGTQQNHIQQHWIHTATTINIISSNNIDGCVTTLYPEEIEYKYEEI